jgi:hypothetical protein
MPLQKEKMDCFVAARLAMTVQQSPSLRANAHAAPLIVERCNECRIALPSKIPSFAPKHCSAVADNLQRGLLGHEQTNNRQEVRANLTLAGCEFLLS